VRIGIDARELCGRSTGVGRYLGGLLHEWANAERARRHEFVLYAPQPIAAPLDARRFPTRVVAGQGGTRWEQQQLLPVVARDYLDVFFAPGYTAPIFARVPLVVAIHDVSFAAHPEWFSAREGLRRRLVTHRVAASARAITTLSEFSKRELMELLAVPADKIHIIRPGITAPGTTASNLRPSLAPDGSNLRGDRLEPRVLYVGSIFNRRHVTDLIRAFAPIARGRGDASLDIVGDNRSYPREDLAGTIAREGLQRQVRCHEYVSEGELRDLYARARAFAFLSEYEGLGMTPLEALAAGVPPVLLDTVVARESCREAAVFVPPNDLRAVTRALASLLFDEAVRARVLAAAPAALSTYSWPKAARETMAVLEHAGSG